MTLSYHRLFGLVATASVLAAVAWGFWIVGSPDTRRLARTDERRVDDLRDIVRAVQARVRDNDVKDALIRPLPTTLAALAAAATRDELSILDPETGEPYAYRVTGETTYELCATFALERDSRHGVFWNHPAGRFCFSIDALDPP